MHYQIDTVGRNTIFYTMVLLVLLALGSSGITAQETGKELLSRAPYIQNTTTQSVSIVWKTIEPAQTYLQYKIETQKEKDIDFADAKRIQIPRLTKHHEVHLNGLKASSKYNYRVNVGGQTAFEGVFQVNKEAGVDYEFLIWGDSGSGGKDQKILAAQMTQHSEPDFILHTGDLIYPWGQPEGFNPFFFNVYRDLLSRIPFYGSIGDHEKLTDGGLPWFDAFILPNNGPEGLDLDSCYYIDYANARIAIIDSMIPTAEMEEKVVPWLKDIMNNSDAAWKFVTMHWPFYSSSKIRDVLGTVFVDVGVDVVFAGHDHFYERFEPIDGVVNVVTGAGGRGLYDRYKRKKEGSYFDKMSAAFWNETYSFTHVSISRKDGKDVLRGRQIDINGKVVDSWEIIKP